MELSFYIVFRRMEVIMLIVLKGLCVIGMVLCIALTAMKIKSNLATEEGKAEWAEQKKMCIRDSTTSTRIR